MDLEAVRDIAPFVVLLAAGLGAGRFLRPPLSYVVLALPLLHLVVSVATGRAAEDLFSYAIPVNALLLALTAAGLIGGRMLRHRTRPES